jgi:DnaJ-class molecular chaperone
MDNYYSILGVEEKSSNDEIKKAFRKLSLKHHPDRGGKKDFFQKINEAYQTLSNPQKKQQYNMSRNGNPLAHLFGQGGPMGGNMAAHMAQMNGQGDVGQMFNMMFGGGLQGNPHIQVFHNGRRVMQKPPTIVKTIEISLEQAYTGINIPLEIERWLNDNGTKRVEKEKIYIEIPAGIDCNEIIMLKDKGNIKGAIKGDIKLFIQVKNNTKFVRTGLDLLITKKISLKEALIGFEFDINHISGKSFKINNINGNIIKPSFKKNVPDLGMIRGNKKGNLVISFEIDFPDKLTEEQKTKINEINF